MSIKRKNAFVPQSLNACQTRVTINVAGTVYETREATLNRYPSTLLGTEEKRRNLQTHKGRKEIFFNRDRRSFESILFFYQSEGKLIRPPMIPLNLFEEDCNYFCIPHENIQKMKQNELKTKQKKQKEFEHCFYNLDTFINYPFCYQPAIIAVSYSCFSITLNFLSIALSCFEKNLASFFDAVQSDLKGDEIVENIELSMIVFFAAECFIRLLASPIPICWFFFDMIHLAEYSSVYLYIILYTTPTSVISPSLRKQFINLLRLLRIIRVHRLGQLSYSIAAAGKVARAVFRDIVTILCLCANVCACCATLIFLVEGHVNPQFQSIPGSLWWAWQTMFCLGYGDVVPITMYGKMTAAVVAFVGIIIMAVLILSLGCRAMQIWRSEFDYHKLKKRSRRKFASKSYPSVLAWPTSRIHLCISFYDTSL